jgi:hypothetical protein
MEKMTQRDWDDDDYRSPDVLRYLRILRQHPDGCCCHACIGALENWVRETTREQREVYEADLKRRIAVSEFTIQQQVQAVEREIKMRQQVYPRQVSTGRMQQAEAELHISEMRAVLKTLQWLEKNRTAIINAVPPKEKVPDAVMGTSK